MTTPPTTSAPQDWLVDGYRRALERFEATEQAREPEERFYPLFEALNWAAAMLDPNSPLHASLISDATVRGLRFARNRVHHDWAVALEPRDVPYPRVTRAVGLGSRIVAPPTVVEWFWKWLHQLPSPPPSRPDLKGQAGYTAHLEGTRARRALDHLDTLLP